MSTTSPSPGHAVGSGLAAAPSAGHCAFPTPWQHVEVIPFSTGRVCLGTVTSSCETFFNVLPHGEKNEIWLNEFDLIVRKHDGGWLPLTFFTEPAAYGLAKMPYKLQRINYDLRLSNGDQVKNCFFKDDKFLEIAGAHRYIALADVTQLRPSA